MASAAAVSYPATLSVPPPAKQSRLSVFFRLVLAIPHAILLYFLGIAVQVVTLIAWFAILFTGRFPAGMYGFVADVLRWQTRVSAYQYLLTGAYPQFSLDEEPGYPVQLALILELTGRNRLTVAFRLILVLPHAIVLWLIGIAAAVALFIGWLVAIFTGSVPAGIHEFLAGTLRWGTRVNAYAWLLTDRYPPFSLS